MQVVCLHALVKQKVRKLFGHFLGERGHEHALVTCNDILDFCQQVIDLCLCGTQNDLRIEQARRTNDLLDGLLAYAFLVIAWRGRNEDELRNALLELIVSQWTVIERTWQTKAMLDERDLATAIALVHAAHLRHRYVALVDEGQKVAATKVIEQRVGRLACFAPVEMTRIILDARTKTHGLEHLEVIRGTLLEALRFQQLAVLLEILQALAQLIGNGYESFLDAGTIRHVMRCRPNGRRSIAHDLLARDAVDLDNLLDFVTEELEVQQVIHVRWKHVDAIAAHSERAAFKLVIVAIVLHVDKPIDELVAIERHLAVYEDRHLGVVLRGPDAIDATYGRDDNDILAREQRRSCRMAHLLDFLVDRRILLDVGIGLRNVCFRLVVVVVTHEVVHGIVGEELLELACELGCQRLIGCENERGHLQALDGLGHREGLARTGDAQ